ncbi:putative secreted protein (Por secretion system target) [Winogradskyella wandonensis]|uniref:Putative secreted protein (Por secretion system target) n=1 Tax=Winogradskyella wandonensis TaxID=1442586 RepID=A0A4R1KTJ9_9FLAO|nr:FG-GAP-like repeat-containing protein [Winogradskyella wandonensis]TCK68515.1 putative secreted protein (Por secretion system target) [Winogradskyella wandonensis]
MLRKLLKNFPLILMVLGFSIQNLSSQTFDRVEDIAGLGILEENNGVAVADYDGDNDLDIFVVARAKDNPDSPKTLSRLFRNNNDGSFTDVTESAGLTDLLSQDEGGGDWFGLEGQKSGASWGDYNNDGFPDLFLTYSFKVQLWRNLGNGTFVNLTSIAGFDSLNDCRNTGATWFDYNNDGFLDIYVSDWDECASNQLFRNNGNNTFTDVTASTGIQATNGLASYVALPFDFNEDGFMDLYISNDFDEPNDLYINNNGTSFSSQAQAFGVDTMGDDMGITIGDYNKDGYFDLFITAIDNNFLLTNNGDNTFTENADTFGLGNTLWAWGTRFSDFDLDGDEDLYVVNGYEFENRSTEPNFYFRNLHAQGQNNFEDASQELNLNELTISVEAIDWDYDNDGDIDLYVTNNDGPSFLYENKTLNFDDASPALHWFKLDLQGTTSNRDAIGTIVKLTTANDTFIRYKSGVGFLSQSLTPVHFGLNDETEILEIEISWPSGLVETYSNLSADVTMKAIEGQGIEVLNIEPSQKVYGCTDPVSCSYNPEATLDDGSCTYLDSQIIVGATNAAFYSTETYTYTLGANSTAVWNVVGGEILSGQGTDTITVHWELEAEGIVSVVESDEQCSSQEISISVELNATDLPDNISIARLWNEALLDAIRGDFARPTVHARNLFHTSVAMYDIWAIYDDQARPYLIGNEVNGFSSELEDFIPINSNEESVREAISYAMYRLLSYRFQNSPGAEANQERIDLLMEKLGYETTFTSVLYEFGNAAALGNYVAQTIIDYGSQDGSRENTGYDNAYYQPVNQAYNLELDNNPPVVDPNRWQPLGLDTFIDQGGNVVEGNVPEFLSPEWGNVNGFALKEEDVTTYNRDGNNYRVFHDPQAPPQINTTVEDEESEQYKWGFSMVSVWQSHLDPTDGVLIDISPGAIGNTDIADFPRDFSEYPSFYNFIEGGDIGTGHSVNPITSSAYEPNIVPRADYARVLAEFWADGPDSETPPGHWFSILNYVNDHPQLEKRFQGEGDVLDGLEWDVKAYFILGGAMHDSAIAAWSVKGWYDYIRPISAIRYMGDEQGQSSDPNLPNYSVSGFKLIPGYIELVEAGDPLAGFFGQNIGKVKLYTWRGHDFINDPATDTAGVGWILAEDWYPYQRPTFVTPPFAGYVSGHSTYSRAASEILTKITGSPFFPGGVGEFVAKKDEFLVFEKGPSVDVVLQWATYRDASDQTSLSRIWGGIHPPADDIPGRFIGQKVADDTFEFAVPYFESNIIDTEIDITNQKIYPNPSDNQQFFISETLETDNIAIFDIRGRKIELSERDYNEDTRVTRIKLSNAVVGLYVLRVNDNSKMVAISK